MLAMNKQSKAAGETVRLNVDIWADQFGNLYRTAEPKVLPANAHLVHYPAGSEVPKTLYSSEKLFADTTLY